ncbi:hypothetical protein [Streptomyces sp. NPDC047070]|uniref:hypothetical protein n=1 Tax=Streptomyces sp. NPDC047070 TaxID=3154923 RepID=UPI003454E317
MPERLTFTLAGRDELSRVMNGTGDAADRLRLRLSGITGDADGRLRDLQGHFLTTADAERRLAGSNDATRSTFRALSDSADKLGEALKANLISLAPAAIPAAAGLAGSAGVLAGQLGAVTVAAAAYGLALGPQIAAIGEAADAQKKYEEAVETSGATSAEAVKAQVEYQRQLAKLPPATREAAVAVGLLKDDFKEWSDELSGDVMGPFTKGVAVANALLPTTTGLVKGASTQFDRLITMVGGGISTPGFDSLNDRFTNFTERTMRRGVDGLTVFLAKLDSGEYDGSGLSEFFDYAQANGPLVWDTLENVGEALLHVLEAGSEVGVGMLDVINALSGVVSAVPPEAIATLLQLAIAVKAVKLAGAGMDAARAGMAALGGQIIAMRTAAAAAPGALAGTTAAIGTLSRGAKLAVAGTGIGLLLIALTELSSHSRSPVPDVEGLTTSLKGLAQTGKVTGEAARAFGQDLSGLGDSLQKVVDPEGLDQVQQSLISFFGMDSTPVKDAKEQIDAVDQALANLVTNGKADLAAAALDNVVAKLEKQGFSADEVRDQMDGYQDALAGAAIEQQLAAESMGLFGDQAQKTQAQLDEQKASTDGLRQSIQALNDVNRQGLSGMIGFEAALDATTKAAAENAGVLDMQNGKLVLTSEKQRTAATALSDLASKTDEATAAARESGASWAEVNGIYDRGRETLIKSAQQMGLTRAEAKALADQILKTPDKTARLKGDMEDLEQKVDKAKRDIKSVPPSKVSAMKGTIADLEKKIATAKDRIKSVPPSKRSDLRATINDLERKVASAKAALSSIKDRSVTITAFVQYKGQNIAKVSAGRLASGGLVGRDGIPGYPGGGLIGGVGTDTSDSNLLWGSRNEYMVKASSVRKYGIAFMDDLNDGVIPIGRPAPRAGLPAGGSATATAAAPERPAVTYNVYPRRSVISVEDLRLLQKQEEARQRVGRPR